MKPHDFAAKSAEADTAEVRARAEGILTAELGAAEYEWTERGGRDDKVGIDVWAILPSGRVGVDLKQRNRAWGDVLLERRSDIGRDSPGWSIDLSKRTAFVLFLWPKTHLLISYPQLRSVARRNIDEWRRLYGDKRAASNGGDWSTDNVAVPFGVFFEAMYGSANGWRQPSWRDLLVALRASGYEISYLADGTLKLLRSPVAGEAA